MQGQLEIIQVTSGGRIKNPLWSASNGVYQSLPVLQLGCVLGT